jgi:hypothetical protein
MLTRARALLCAALSTCLLSLTVQAPASAEPAGPPIPEEICTPLEANARWEGRTSDDAWAEGLYPARDDVESGVVALTFDDGPHRHRTPTALEGLEKRGWTATFFVTGAAIRPSTFHLVKRIVDEGHVLGNHAWRHDTRMSRRFESPEELEAYLAAEFELTQIRVDLAMLATSRDDFVGFEERVFDGLRRRDTPEAEVEAMPALRARHAEVLAEHGYSEARRPYRVEWARPPGGNPYLGHHSAPQRDAFARALASQSLKLVMWNGGSSDSNPHMSKTERQDPTHLQTTVRKMVRRGGIYVMHDRIAKQSLHTVLAAFAARDAEIVSLDELMQRKLRAQGRCVQPGEPIDMTVAQADTPSRGPA